MKSEIVSYSDLELRGHWKAEHIGRLLNKKEYAWDVVRVGDLIEVRRESLNPQESPGQTIMYLGLENVESNTGKLVEFSPKKGGDIRSVSKIFREGDILYGRLRPYLNKVYLAEDPVNEGICSTEFIVLIARIDTVIPKYLRFMMSSSDFREHAIIFTSGSTLPRLQTKDLLDIEVPCPPIDEQKKVVKAIEAISNAYHTFEQLMSELEKETTTAINDLLHQADGKNLLLMSKKLEDLSNRILSLAVKESRALAG